MYMFMKVENNTNFRTWSSCTCNHVAIVWNPELMRNWVQLKYRGPHRNQNGWSCRSSNPLIFVTFSPNVFSHSPEVGFGTTLQYDSSCRPFDT